jgi:hypothetical protein
MKRTHRRRKCGQCTPPPALQQKYRRLWNRAWHAGVFAITDGGTPSIGGRFQHPARESVPSRPPNLHAGTVSRAIVSSRSGGRLPIRLPDRPQPGRREAGAALSLRYTGGIGGAALFACVRKPERPPRCRRRGGPRSLPFRSTLHSDTVCATGRAKEGDADSDSGACGS